VGIEQPASHLQLVANLNPIDLACLLFILLPTLSPHLRCTCLEILKHRLAETVVNSDKLVPARRAISSDLFWAVISWSNLWCDIITCSTRLTISSARPCQPATPHAICCYGSGTDVRVSATFFPLLFPRSCSYSLRQIRQIMVSTTASKNIRREKLLGRPAAGSLNQFPIIFCAASDNRLTDSRNESEKGRTRGTIQYTYLGIDSQA
jgi:hypothetical protein